MQVVVHGSATVILAVPSVETAQLGNNFETGRRIVEVEEEGIVAGVETARVGVAGAAAHVDDAADRGINTLRMRSPSQAGQSLSIHSLTFQ